MYIVCTYIYIVTRLLYTAKNKLYYLEFLHKCVVNIISVTDTGKGNNISKNNQL